MTDEQRRTRQPGYPGEAARQGRIVLNSRLRQTTFIAGLASIVIILLIIAIVT